MDSSPLTFADLVGSFAATEGTHAATGGVFTADLVTPSELGAPDIIATPGPQSRGTVRMFGQAFEFDWLNPNYNDIWARRLRKLAELRSNPRLLEGYRVYYRDHVADFINDWGVTVDPRNAGSTRPIKLPFMLFDKQREFVDTIIEQWRATNTGESHGLELVKSRDCGASWLAMGTAVTLCLFWRNVTFGFGSAKEDKVDRSGDPDCLFYKGRQFVRYLPREFRGAWDIKRNSSHMRMDFPDSESSITGEAGDNIGRGGRKTIYFVDEFAFVERPKLVDASLSANTNCRIEMSSVNGLANVFAERARSGKHRRFDFSFMFDPRKVDQSTKTILPHFQKFLDDLDEVVKAAEYYCDFLASVEGIIIPQEWVLAAVNAHVKLGITPSGMMRGAYDVADRGQDKNCYGSRHGILVRYLESWSGKGSDIFASTERSFRLADQLGDDGFDYDGDGMGAGVRGDARKIAEARAAHKDGRGRSTPMRALRVDMFRGSSAVIDPDSICPGTDRKNIDFFENFKAQSWWSLRRRFNLTWRAVTGVVAPGKFNPSDIISLDPQLPELTKTCAELSQPVWTWSKSGKMMIDKTPDEVASPNNGDTVMMLFASRPPLVFSEELLAQL